MPSNSLLHPGIRSMPILSDAFNDTSKGLVSDEATTLVSDFDSEFSALEQLKSLRDIRLTETSYVSSTIDATITYFGESTDKRLAESLKEQGNNDKLWCFCLFVGSESQLAPIKELFT